MTGFDDEYRALSGDAASWIARGFGQFEVSGPDANAFVNRIATADLSVLTPGSFVHSLLLHDDATILDRVTVYRFPERVMLLVDGAQREAAWDDLVSRKRGNVRLRDISQDMGVIVVRGPHIVARLDSVLNPMPATPGTIVTARLGGVDVFAARATGDGPDGFDCYCRTRDLAAVESILAGTGVVPVGDRVWQLHRLEWGMATVGVDIDPDDTPLEAGLDHLVAEGKGAPFPGELAFAARRRTGAIKRLVGFHVTGNELPPSAARVSVAGLMVDRVRAIGRSPRVGIIGTTAIPISAESPGTMLSIVSGEKCWDARVVNRPFVARTIP